MLIFVLAVVIGVSQGADTGNEKVSKPDPQRTSTQNAQPVPPPISVTVTSPTKTKEEREQEAREREAEVTDRTRDVKAQETMAAFTQRLFWLGSFQLVAAVAAVIAAFAAVRVTKASEKHFRLVERAYVAASMVPPGLRFISDRVDITVRFTSHGNTPARITGVGFRAFALQGSPRRGLPEIPDYFAPRRDPQHWTKTAFLVKGDSLESHAILHLECETFIRLETDSIYVIGYCDYVDIFGGRHRLGWARQYSSYIDKEAMDPTTGRMRPDRNNLRSVSARGYDYDRFRKKGEGDDW